MKEWMLIKDDDCHWYCIPVSKRDLFRSLLDVDENLDEFIEQFEKYSIGGSYTLISFSNPKIDGKDWNPEA